MKNSLKKIVAIISLVGVAGWAGGVQALTADELQVQIEALMAQLAILQSQLTTLQGGTTPAVTGCSITSFDRSLKVGMSGDDVKCLQITLNASADTQVNATGVGSSGNETMYFGPLTMAAVIKFQEKYASEILAFYNLTSGTGFVGSTTRAKLNTMLTSGETTIPDGGDGVVLPSVGVPTASLATGNPVAATVPFGAVKAPLLKVTLQAASADVTITGLTFKRTGVGAYDDWPNLYLYDGGGNRLTNISRSLGVDTQAVEFPTLNISVGAGKAVTVFLRGDAFALTGRAGYQSAFQLTSIVSNATFTGLPLTGNIMTLAGVGVSAATIVAGISPSDPVVGAEQAEIATFKITAGDQDIKLSQAIINITGDITRADITNLKLYYMDELLAETAAVDTYDSAIFTLEEPYEIGKSLARSFSVKADLGGKVGRTLIARIYENTDVLVTDKVYGYGATVSGAPTTASTITLQGGTFTLANNGPSAGYVSKNTQDVVLLKVGLTADRSLEVRKLNAYLTISDATGTGAVSDLRIKDADTGATLMQQSSVDFAALATSSNDLTGSFVLSPGVTKNVQITVDTANASWLEGKTLQAELRMVTYSGTTVYVRDINTGDYLEATNVVPQTVAGKIQTVTAISLTTSLSSSPISGTVITGAGDVSAVGFTLLAGAGSGASVRSIQVKVYVNTAVDFAAGTEVTTPNAVAKVVRLYNGSTLLGTKTLTNTASCNSTHDCGVATFSSLNFSLAKSASEKLTVKIDTVSNLLTDRYIAVEVLGAGIAAYDDDQSEITISTNVNAVTAGATPSRYITVQTEGTLSLAKNNASSPLAGNVSVGTTGVLEVTLLAIDLTGTKEPIKVKKIVVERAGDAYSSSTAYTTLKLGDKVAEFEAGATSTYFEDIEDGLVIVPKDDKVTLTIKADLAGIGNGADSGNYVSLSVATSTIEAIGVSSGVAVGSGGSNAAGAAQYLYKTNVLVNLSSDSPQGVKAKGSNQDVFYYNVENTGSYSATLATTTFTITYSPGSTGNATTATERIFSLYDSIDTGTQIATTSIAADTEITLGTTTLAFTLATPLSISAGATKKIILKGDTTDVGKDGIFQFNIAAKTDLTWNDGVSDIADLTKNLPITGGTITYSY